MKHLSLKARRNLASTNPKHNRLMRRDRPQYPQLAPGETEKVHRVECGVQRPFVFFKLIEGKMVRAEAKRLVQAFVFHRAKHVDRSRYCPVVEDLVHNASRAYWAA